MALKKAGVKILYIRKNSFLLDWLFGLLWQQDRLNVREDTTLKKMLKPDKSTTNWKL